ncbi:glycosyltransferase family 2 protein [Melioribacteraceae bacterium 4301-Me]|uniref:glycosyltransferase family 2 protein n=1 Tax=Pyranulibacter aquaticus TaxID=3163344 RepID=UPI0035993CD6
MIPKVSIIVLNWNGLADTLECLQSVQKINYGNFDVILVDNNSSGNDVEVIMEKFGEFLKVIIVNDSNKGFAGGNNVGIRYALENNSDFVLLLNNDTIVEPDFLDKLIEQSTQLANIGILTPKIFYYTNRDQIWSAGGYISKIRASGFQRGFNKKGRNYYNINKYCSFATGCCMLIKREVIEKVGLLDERFFLYLEDTDYCYRAINAGFKIRFVANSKIYHKVNTTTKMNGELLPLYYTIRNRLFFAKNRLGFWFYLFYLYLVVTMNIKIFISRNGTEIRKIYKLATNDFSNEMMGQLTKKIFNNMRVG